ncbi:NADH-quinone oxidoreductase subunit L [Chitinophagaceae bacterium LB-8]|uniref:NADH-quinone oxidoreductase subunit L n=1 Tax=Paraflavisolibacter caeni TaxID=2982496 RepID=A0A9X2XY45_9BACT|nr:NADH-quinone oxidoreductase subunit L [Paraflavisolibacter caeni]MCU7550872.1 NADH-quinone oxidoreductase subunit L [Paraflavisolibacter caeni]
MPNVIILVLIPFLPLASFLILGLFGKSIFRNTSGLAGTLSLFVSFLLSIYTSFGYFFEYGKANGIYQKLVPLKLSWLEFSNGLSIDMGIILDPISVMMIMVVTFISLMVHIYSLTYMKGEERFSTYYSYLSLFTFSMLGLVLSSNIFQIYIFWELVGVSSFLLIGFYYNKPSAVAASKKAFIVTRFADLGFLIGILVLSFYSGTLDFNTLIQRLTSPGSGELKTAVTTSFLGISALNWGLALVFMGGAGKSALFPLHIWLPDAMEGPTPVSALIHAATMVVAGVYLVARLFPVLALSAPEVLELITLVGVITALIAALIACTQTDIKRVLAYSTMSQIGFMMFALGVSGYGGSNGIGFTASMFHLFTHALFKALLFLGAGSVIHYVHSNEMKDMGGLKKHLPITHITFLIACLAIAGVPPFSGFFSKEGILLAAYEHNPAVFWLALATSGLTAYYMFRLYFRIFWYKASQQHKHHGEGGFAMMLPLILLAVGAAVAGFIPFGRFVSSDGSLLTLPFHWLFSIAPVTLGLLGIFSAMVLFKKENGKADQISSFMSRVYKLVYHKFYVDEIYLFITRKVLFSMVGRPAAWIDRNIIDGLVNLSGATTKAVSERIKVIQSGKVQHYGLYFLFGVIGLGVLLIYVIKF